jgi:hypothetical protein
VGLLVGREPPLVGPVTFRAVAVVGALTGGASGLSGGAPDRSCRLSGAPTARALSSARAGAH